MTAVLLPLGQKPVPIAVGVERCADGHGTWSYLFFSTNDREIARAKALCRECDLRSECLAGAAERREPGGVWGGMLFVMGVPVASRPTRGRPPGVSRPQEPRTSIS